MKKKILFGAFLFLIFTIAGYFLLPGFEFFRTRGIGVVGQNSLLKVFDLFLPDNFVQPTMFRVGMVSLVLASALSLLVSFFSSQDEKKAKESFLMFYGGFFLITIIFYIVYIADLAGMRTYTIIVKYPGSWLYISAVIFSLLTGAFILWIITKIEDNPLKRFIIVCALLVLAWLFVKIPPVHFIYKNTARPVSQLINKIIEPDKPVKKAMEVREAPKTAVEKEKN